MARVASMSRWLSQLTSESSCSSTSRVSAAHFAARSSTMALRHAARASRFGPIPAGGVVDRDGDGQARQLGDDESAPVGALVVHVQSPTAGRDQITHDPSGAGRPGTVTAARTYPPGKQAQLPQPRQDRGPGLR